MALFPSLPQTPRLGDLLMRYPDNAGTLLRFIEGVLRRKGELSIGERELIAAYVSGLNACTFCFGSHRVYAEIFGIKAGLIDALLEDIETAPIAENLKPVFRYVQKLNTLPSRLVPGDSEAVFAAGWSEAALFEAVEVTGLFNMMNRIVEGSGVSFDYDKHPEVADELRGRERHSYLDFAAQLGV